MRAWLEHLTIRRHIALLVAAILLPGAVVVAWLLAADAGDARVETQARIEILADNAVAIALGAGVVLVSLVLVRRLSAAIVHPVRELATATAELAQGNSTVRIRAGGPTEIATVAAQFNRMLDAREAGDAARREADARYRMLVDWSPEAVSVHVDGIVRFVNRACVDLLGADSADELIGQPSLNVIQPEHRDDVRREVADALEQHRAIPTREQTFSRRDGSSIVVEVAGTPIVFEGRPALLASMRDISARRQTEAALAKSEAQLRGIVASATVAIITVDATQTIVSANPAAGMMFRRASAELVGTPLEHLIPERYRSDHRHDMQRFASSGDAPRHMGRQRDVMGLRSDGEEFPVDAAISHLNIDGEQLYTVILRDISERRRTEAALRETEASLRQVLMTLPEAVFVSSGHRISFVNAAATRLFDSDAASLVGCDPLSLIHPDSVEPVRSRIATLPGGLQTAPLTRVKIVRADGAVRLVELAATLVDERGSGAVVVMMRDVTELVEARQELADSHADLRRLVAAQNKVQEDERKRIARELHDDLQQTLAAIYIDLVTTAQRFASEPHGVAPPMLDEAAELAATAIESTRRIINDLRPQMLEDLGLVPALEALVDQFGRRAGIACRVAEQDDSRDPAPLPMSVATCLYRVTQEALTNVAKHAQATEVLIRFQRAADGSVALRISDNGRGMWPGAPRKPMSFGLLGMHERVRALGATLRIDSRPHAGTTIEVDVPPPGAAAGVDATQGSGVAPTAPSAVSGPLLSATIDALDGSIAVLDRHGVILLVNRAWRTFAERGGDPGLQACGPGQNYLEVCRHSASSDAHAARVLEGLQAVLDGRQASFGLDYPCQAPDGLRWFRMRAAPVDERCLLVTHTDLTPADRERRPDTQSTASDTSD